MKKNILILLLAVVVVVFVAHKYNQTQQAVTEATNGVSREKIEQVVVLKAFDAMTAQAEKGEVIYDVECLGTKSMQVDCHSIGNALHKISFVNTSVMSELKIKGQRGLDGKLQLVELSGVPNKLTPAEANVLVTMFEKPVR